MTTLVQISDTHFGTERPAVVAALLQLVAETRPEMVVLSGDITQRARRSQFDAARAFADRLRTRKVLVVPGNHDIPLLNVPARLLFPYAGFRRAFGNDLEPRHETGTFCVIGVRTTRRYRHIDGEISAEQVRRVAQALRQATAESIRIVVTHQPVHVIHEWDETNLLHGHEAAVRAWAEAGADLIMGGHIHLPYVRPLSERFTDLPRELWCVQAGTAVSHRVRRGAPNSINMVRRASAGPLGCSIERWDYMEDQQGFVPVHTQQLTLDRH